MRLIQIDCKDLSLTKQCCDNSKQERIPLVIFWPDTGEWQVIRSCCVHYHELKVLHDKNLEIYRQATPVAKQVQPIVRRVTKEVKFEDYLDI